MLQTRPLVSCAPRPVFTEFYSNRLIRLTAAQYHLELLRTYQDVQDQPAGNRLRELANTVAQRCQALRDALRRNQ